MSAKLVVYKFESGMNNLESLQITFDDGKNVSNTVHCSEWSCAKKPQKDKKHNEESSRLVVKRMDTGAEYSSINLDSCAKELEHSEMYHSNFTSNSTISKQNLLCYEVNDTENTTANVSFHKPDNVYQNNGLNNYDVEDTFGRDIANSLDDLSPLEYSLERVKENNARIMENIQMLNRTLIYTKNKESLDIAYPNSMRYPCNLCGKCFVYETGLKRHYSMQHSIKEIQPRWQVVWTCVECFQVWPRQDLQQCCIRNNVYSVREIKTSLLLQCEFCEKVYTSIPRLLRHSKLHSTARNYECNACEASFQSYREAEQHWLACPWQKMCYSFSLPKMLLCNACDRKFKNYEQLYNHRYKVGHFMTKVHFNNNVKTIANSLPRVYQCEICGQWFLSVPPLQAHRSQHQPMCETVQIQQY